MRAYRDLLATRGVPWIVAALVLGGTAGTMAPVSLVLFARAATRSFATASLVLAALTAGRLLTAPWRGRLVDRRGPAWALIVLGAPSVLTDIAFIVIGRTHPGAPPLVAAGALAGAVSVRPWTAVRSVWATLLPDDGRRRTGIALMSVIAEVNFFSGPLLAGTLIAAGSPTPATRAVAGARRSPARAGRDRDAGARRDLRALRAHLRRPRHRLAGVRSPPRFVAAGLLLSLFALGSGLGGLVYGARRHTRTAVSLYPRMALLAALGTIPVLAVSSVVAMALAAIISGACFAPLSTLQTASIEEVVAAGHRAEAYNWVGTVYGAGSALGAVLAGELVSAGGTRAAFGASALATALAAVVVICARGALRAGEPPDTVTP